MANKDTTKPKKVSKTSPVPKTPKPPSAPWSVHEFAIDLMAHGSREQIYATVHEYLEGQKLSAVFHSDDEETMNATWNAAMMLNVLELVEPHEAFALAAQEPASELRQRVNNGLLDVALQLHEMPGYTRRPHALIGFHRFGLATAAVGTHCFDAMKPGDIIRYTIVFEESGRNKGWRIASNIHLPCPLNRTT